MNSDLRTYLKYENIDPDYFFYEIVTEGKRVRKERRAQKAAAKKAARHTAPAVCCEA